MVGVLAIEGGLKNRLLEINENHLTYSIYKVTPFKPTVVYKSTVAPTSELNGLVQRVGDGGQEIIPNRSLWSVPRLIGIISN